MLLVICFVTNLLIPLCNYFEQFGSNQIKLIEMGSNQIKLDPIGSNWYKLDQTRKKIHPTSRFLCYRLKIPSYLPVGTTGNVGFLSYPYIRFYPFFREVRVCDSTLKIIYLYHFYSPEKQ